MDNSGKQAFLRMSLDMQQPREGKEGYLDIVQKEQHQLRDDSVWSSIKGYGKTIAKGLFEGGVKMGRMVGGRVPDIKKGMTAEDVMKQLQNPQDIEDVTADLDRLLPTEESFGQKAIRRGLRQLPSNMALPGAAVQTAVRTGLAGLAGQTAQELGAPEYVQSLAELGMYIGPDLVQKLVAAGKNKELIEIGKRLGISDEALAPLLRQGKEQALLAKVAPKSGQTERILANTKEELGSAYSTMQKSSEAQKVISSQNSAKLMANLRNELKQMPSEVSSKIEKDFDQLISKQNISGDDLIDFYKKVNYYTGSGTKQLSTLKGPIKEAIETISPELGKDFETINKLFSRYYKISSMLKPTIKSQIIEAGAHLAILHDVLTGFPATTSALIGSKMARDLLLKPRFQQLSIKTVDALNKNAPQIALKSIQEMADLMSKYDEKASDDLKSLSLKDIEKLIVSQKKPSKK